MVKNSKKQKFTQTPPQITKQTTFHAVLVNLKFSQQLYKIP